MAKTKLTAGRISDFQCPIDKAQSFLWCSEVQGLAVRATPSSTRKRFIFESKVKGKTVRMTIGEVSVWSISQAQQEARRLQTIIDQGNDPRQIKIELDASKEAEIEASALKARRESITLAMVWPIYIEARKNKWSEWHIRDHENIVNIGGVKKIRGKGFTEPGPLASLLNVKLADLSGITIGKWLALETASRPTRAALAFRLLSGLINWCESQSDYSGLIPSGACKAQQVRDELPSKKSKEGDCLQREQLKPWFDGVINMVNVVESAYLQALLMTGARRRELAALRWTDIDFKWMSLTIRDKVEGERTIPLTPYVARLLSKLPKNNEWVFSSAVSASGYLTEPRLGHQRALAKSGLPSLSIHGLRRSFGSLAEWTETPTGVVAQIMGHKPSALAEKHYRRRPLDLLRKWHINIESWILEQAEIKNEETFTSENFSK
ncbi:MAG: preprotein translocase [Proteobacteria bacterium ST_bin12]|nr:MAG: preprotein translocase [Proteobacteria bacterium ST_bin12]